MCQWKEYLKDSEYYEDDLISLVNNNPMHIGEIDYFAKQAFIQSAIDGQTNKVTVKDITIVIERYHKQHSKPLLFGR